MVFQCQRDSFQKEFTTKVEKVEKKGDQVEVIFADTVFFPEGNLIKIERVREWERLKFIIVTFKVVVNLTTPDILSNQVTTIRRNSKWKMS